MKTTIKNVRGFTIVELLIVIVIIGILAAITIVAYNGIQQRGKNTQRITVAKDWHKNIMSYIAANGSYPWSAGHLCLGSGYDTNWDANPDEDCGWSNNVKHPDTTVNTKLSATLGSLPQNLFERLKTDTGTAFAGGYSMRTETTNNAAGTSVANYPSLMYWLDGNNQDCVLRPIIIYTPSLSVSSTATFSQNNGPSTLCRIGLPDPTSL